MKLIQGDCLVKMKEMDSNSVDAIVTDPPYGLSFMGKKWDYDVPSKEIWEEALRVLKSGGYLLAFAGTRTQHRMAVNIEDAGFEIRDMIAWVYGSGFPKSLNIGKAVEGKIVLGSSNVKDIKKLKGKKKEVSCGFNKTGKNTGYRDKEYTMTQTDVEYTTDEAKQWEGWGTALKPALEPITVARKPLSEKTVAENVLKWGTGGINIDGSRVGTETIKNVPPSYRGKTGEFVNQEKNFTKGKVEYNSGRFPANLIHDGSDEVVDLFPNTKTGAVKNTIDNGSNQPINLGGGLTKERPADSGSASRFFYCAKASKRERNAGCEGLESEKFTAGNYSQSPVCKTCDKTLNGTNDHSKCSGEVYYREMESKKTSNNHPTVKPIALMEYLVKLVSREGATVLDPFMGSGTTGIACKKLGRKFIGIEMEKEYIKIAKARIEHAK